MRWWGDGITQADVWVERKDKEAKVVEKENLLGRIVIDPNVMVGKPVIKGTRLTIQYILGLLAHGATVSEILQEYEGLTQADILACLLFATKALESTTFVPLAVEMA